jgi:DNA modification methylase
MKINHVYDQDCLDMLKKIKDNSIDFIITSPPYADNRKKTYDGVPVKKYVQWFLPISAELKRVLKPNGSFVLNIKESAKNGERSTYVLELILEMKKQGWLWTEEYVWHKKNAFPGKWPNRFRDAWERCLHFTKQKKFKMYQKHVMVPMGDWAQLRLKNLSHIDKTRNESKVMSGFGKNISNWIGRKAAYPTNVLHMATECSNVNHSAAFPVTLPMWFIKLFTKEGDVVLDPFMGSGTTAIAALHLKRYFLGSEKNKKYHRYALKRINEFRKESQKDEFITNLTVKEIIPSLEIRKTAVINKRIKQIH